MLKRLLVVLAYVLLFAVGFVVSAQIFWPDNRTVFTTGRR